MGGGSEATSTPRHLGRQHIDDDLKTRVTEVESISSFCVQQKGGPVV
jgi:hypothetical protein